MKDFKIYITIASLLLVGYIIAQYNRPKPTNWKSTLYYNDKIPYGTFILHHQLKQLFPGAEVSRTNLSPSQVFQDTDMAPGNYLIIAHGVAFQKTDWKALEGYIRRGNNVFISAFSWRGTLADTLNLETGYTDAKEMRFAFTNPQLKAGTDYKFKGELGAQYFSSFDTTRAISLSRNQQGQTNYLRYQFGKGNLYLFATPHLLTNYSLLKPAGAAYISHVLSYLPDAEHIYWDQYQNHDIPEDESPLRVLFAHENLRWAYYISLAAMLLFIAFEAKRRQRIIPVIEPLSNATTDFVNVVGRVYYEQRNHNDIALKKITYLADYLRTRYQLRAAFGTKEFAEKLTQKTGMQPAFIHELLSHINYVSVQSKIDDHELILLNNLIDKFYAQA
ncbi:hypothetical protein GCM10027037_20370 [Mucilaginibacter koreensis]